VDFDHLKIEYLEELRREKGRLCVNGEEQQENDKHLIKGLKFLGFP